MCYALCVMRYVLCVMRRVLYDWFGMVWFVYSINLK